MTFVRRTLLFGAYCLCLAVSHLQVLRALFGYSQHNVAASHVVLIPVVSAILIHRNRATIFSSVRTVPAAGLGIIVSGLFLSAIAGAWRSTTVPPESLTLAAGALVVLSLGGFLLFYGWEAFRRAMFPVAFLMFMIPIPQGLLDGATLFLKTGSTNIVAALFTLTGTPYHQDGFTFALPNLVIEIVDECSGIRSSIALFLTALLAGHMFLRSPWKRALLVVSVLPVAILKNAIRIVSLSLLSIHVDRAFLAGRLHHEGGIVFFLLALAMLTPLLSVLRNSEPDETVGTRRI